MMVPVFLELANRVQIELDNHGLFFAVKMEHEVILNGEFIMSILKADRSPVCGDQLVLHNEIFPTISKHDAVIPS